MRTRSMKWLVAGLAAAALLAGCGNSDEGTGKSGTDGSKTDSTIAGGLPAIPESDWVDLRGQDSVVIEARDNVFKDENVVVSPGTKIVFDNVGRNPHNVIPSEKGQFEEIPVSKLQPKDTAPLDLSGEGEFPYYCSLHGTPKAGMKGRIKVAGD